MAAPVQDRGAPARIEDYLFSLEGGMDSGSATMLLGPNQFAFGSNLSIRGDFFTHRPPWLTRSMTFDNPSSQATVLTGYFQGWCYYKPLNNLPEQMVAAISGRLFLFTPQPNNSVTVSDISPSPANPASATQAWLWQAEQFVIWNDGVSAPVFFDGTITFRSNWAGANQFTTTTQSNSGTVQVGSAATLNFTSTANMRGNTGTIPGDVLTIQGCGGFQVSTVVNGTQAYGAWISGNNGASIPSGSNVSWTHQNFQLPAGRMGAYVLGRNWMALPDGLQFIASDLVGGSSGSLAYNFKDSVLSVTENTYLIGGGNFTVPPWSGGIKSIIALPTIDASLGQGPVLILTPKAGFTCNSPTDRTQWTKVTNPILTQSMMSNAALGQESTTPMNSDIVMRALEGVRSLILTRNDFQAWGNTIMSHEVLQILSKDNQALLPWGSARVFDNRLLMTFGPQQGPNGVFHSGLVALNLDPISSLAGKQPSVWEGQWLGPNPASVLVGSYSLVERFFAFCFNPTTSQNEIHELLPEETTVTADDTGPVDAYFESAFLFKDQDPRKRRFKQLSNGEIYFDELLLPTTFKVYYRSDFYPTYTLWKQFTVTPDPKQIPGFSPRAGLGEPDPLPCDSVQNRPLRQGFTFQVKIEIIGHCIFRGARFEAIEMPLPIYAQQIC